MLDKTGMKQMEEVRKKYSEHAQRTRDMKISLPLCSKRFQTKVELNSTFSTDSTGKTAVAWVAVVFRKKTILIGLLLLTRPIHN